MRWISLFLIIFLLRSFSGYGQSGSYKIKVQYLPVKVSNKYELDATGVKPGSEIITIRDKVLLQTDYTIDYLTGFFSLSESLSYSIFDTLRIEYQALQSSLSKIYKKRELQSFVTLAGEDTIRGFKGFDSFLSPDNIFGQNIQKSGTLVRGFTFGTNKDLSLQSGLKLQLSGKLTDDIEIVAALSDENTPIQPEGNTERLDEIDKVFIQITHPNARGVFGDYDLLSTRGEFGRVSRKLQGLYGEVRYDKFNGFFALASSRGKFNSNMFQGQEGVQGPYRLSGSNGERDIIIIAGSEKVFLNGEEMRRGDNNDYTIDYSSGELIFTTRRVITSSSRINVDFEYSDRKYGRNFFSAGTDGELFGSKLKYSLQFIQEGDDKDNPIDFSLSEQDKEILKNAGGDRNKAIKPGERLADPDSTGRRNGFYEKRDTVTGTGQSLQYYLYNPGSQNAVYNVSFSYTGAGNGDYTRESIGKFRYVGKGFGVYSPVIFIPLPEKRQAANFVIEYQPLKYLSFKGEIAGSILNKNQFSTLDGTSATGFARNFEATFNPVTFSVFNVDFSSLTLKYRERFVAADFSSPDRFNSVEFDRDYNTGNLSQRGGEILREAGFSLYPIPGTGVDVSYGYLKNGNNFISERINGAFRSFEQGERDLSYSADFVSTENVLLKSGWLKQKAAGTWKIGFINPGAFFESEIKKERIISNDSLLSGSYYFYEAGPLVEIPVLWGINFTGKMIFREDEVSERGIFIKESRTTGQEAGIKYQGNRDFNIEMSVAVREKRYEPSFKLKGFSDNQTVLLRMRSRFALFGSGINGDLFYEASTRRASLLERVFVKVEKGTGNYIYLGDLNKNGLYDENEFQPAIYDADFIAITIPSETLYPVIDLKTGFRVKILFRDLAEEGLSFLKPLDFISSETTVRIEENSKENDIEKIYLLKLSWFLNDKNTIRGAQSILQDIFIFENNSDLNFRLRFNERNSFTEFSGGAERGLLTERSLRTRLRLVREFSIQADVMLNSNNLAAPPASLRNRKINSTDFVLDFSYRPENYIETGFIIKTGVTKDEYPTTPTELKTNSQILRVNFSFAGTGRVRFEVERVEIIKNDTENFLPFELTNGNLVGKNYYWRLNFDYRISTNLQSTLGYDGRSLGGGRVIHSARAEVRAFF